MNDAERLADIVKKIGIPSAQRHLFLCPGPDCCSPELGQEAWEHLKKRLAEMNLPFLRTKAGCFKICMQGPILLVYPDGIWYSRVTPEKIDRIIEEHLIGGKPVVEWIFAEHPF